VVEEEESPDRLCVLLVDDDESNRELAAFNLKRAGYEVEVAVDGASALRKFRPQDHAVVITDIRMPGVSGMEVLSRIRGESPDTAVIVVTAYGNVELAVEAMKEGASDFIGKPFNRDHLLVAVERASEAWCRRRELERLRNKARGVEQEIIFRSVEMENVLRAVDQAAGSDAPVWITGEQGVGKETLARRVHARSPRSSGAFEAIRVSTIPTPARTRNLFGADGSSSDVGDSLGRIARAAGGTVYVGDCTDLDEEQQRALLGIMERDTEREPSGDWSGTRFVFGSELNPRKEASEGRLLGELLYRGAVVEIHVPPLRSRREDIEPLARHFVDCHAKGRSLEIPPDVVEALATREWIGNVRELSNACERLVILAPDDRLRFEDLPPQGLRPASSHQADDPFDTWPPLPDAGLSLVDLEHRIIQRVLVRTEGNVTAAAAYLKVPRHVLAYRMEKYGIKRSG
jgi:two-component system NtrC family response regulator